MSNWVEEEEKLKLKNAKRMSKVIKKHLGFNISKEDCKDIWQAHSLDFHAGWLYLDEKDEDLAKTLKRCIDEIKRNNNLGISRDWKSIRKEKGVSHEINS